MRIKKTLLALTAALTLGAGVANAGPLTIVGGTIDTFPSNNNIQAPDSFVNLPPNAGFFATNVVAGPNLFLDAAAGSPWKISFYYVGKEAGYTNEFYYGPGDTFGRSTATPPAFAPAAPGILMGSILMNATGGLDLIPFRFLTTNTGNSVANGSNNNVGPRDGYTNFALTTLQYTQRQTPTTDGWVVYAALDDRGAGPDDNHDDMVIRIEATSAAVPEPASMVLLGSGLLGLAGAARRRARK